MSSDKKGFTRMGGVTQVKSPPREYGVQKLFSGSTHSTTTTKRIVLRKVRRRRKRRLGVQRFAASEITNGGEMGEAQSSCKEGLGRC